MQGVGSGLFVVQVFLGERVAEVMGVDVLLEEVQLLADVRQVVAHDGQQLVELAEIGLGEVEDVEIVVDLLLRHEGQHGVAPAELVAQRHLIALLERLEGDAVFLQLGTDAWDGAVGSRFGPAPASGEEQDRTDGDDQITK